MNADGSGSASKVANQTLQQSQDETSVTALSNGQFVISWTSDDRPPPVPRISISG